MDKEKALGVLRQENEQLKAKISSNEQERTFTITTAVSAQKYAIVEKDKQILLFRN